LSGTIRLYRQVNQEMELITSVGLPLSLKKVEQAKVQANTKTTSTSTPKKTKVKIKSGK
jgi:hypothetical protein